MRDRTPGIIFNNMPTRTHTRTNRTHARWFTDRSRASTHDRTLKHTYACTHAHAHAHPYTRSCISLRRRRPVDMLNEVLPMACARCRSDQRSTISSVARRRPIRADGLPKKNRESSGNSTVNSVCVCAECFFLWCEQ